MKRGIVFAVIAVGLLLLFDVLGPFATLGIIGFAFAAVHAFWLVARARLDHHIVLGRRTIRFRDAKGDFHKLDYRAIELSAARDKLAIGAFVIPVAWLPHAWSVRDLATRIRARKAGCRDDISEALAVSGSDAVLVVRSGKKWRVRETFNAEDVPAVVASIVEPARLVCRSRALGKIQAMLAGGYRTSSKVELSAIEIPW